MACKLSAVSKHYTTILALSSVFLFGSFQLIKPFGVKIVVIDAGHGGKDPGCSGVKYKEKDVALAVALKLGAYIEQNCKDVKVIYTRRTDVFVELQERAAIANRNNADLFICVHCNANPKKEAHGSETYVMGIQKSEGNLDVAKRENSSILLEDNYKKNYEGFDPNTDEGNILFRMYMNKHLEQALNLSAKIQNHYRENAKRQDKGVKQAGFWVLWRTTMTSLLTETGFLTNPAEEKFLGSEKGQDYLALSLFRAFREYKDDIEGHKTKYNDQVESIPDYVPPKDSLTSLPTETAKDCTVTNNPPIKSAVPAATDTVYFSVQLYSSDKKIQTGPDNFKGIENVRETIDRGRYKYLVGRVYLPEDAAKLQSEVRKKGFADAFVQAFQGTSRISMEEAKKLLKK